MRFELALSRAHPYQLGVELTIEVDKLPWAEGPIVAAYGIDLEIGDRLPDAELASAMLGLATETAPAILYPFLRQAVADAALKGGASLDLPLVSWEEMFQGVVIPPPEGGLPEGYSDPAA